MALFGALEAPGGVSADHAGLESQKGKKKSEQLGLNGRLWDSLLEIWGYFLSVFSVSCFGCDF